MICGIPVLSWTWSAFSVVTSDRSSIGAWLSGNRNSKITSFCVRPTLCFVVCGVRNKFGMHEFFALPTACLVRLHLKADALGMENCLCQYASCHFVIKSNSTSDGSRVKATVPMTHPDVLRVISQTTFSAACSTHVQMNR